jgi:hypothetical protein
VRKEGRRWKSDGATARVRRLFTALEGRVRSDGGGDRGRIRSGLDQEEREEELLLAVGSVDGWMQLIAG